MPRRHSSPLDNFFSSLDSIIKATPKILQDAVIGLAIVLSVQAFLSTYIPVWLVTIGVASYTVWCLYREGLAILKSRSFRIFGISIIIFLVDLYFTLVV